MTTPISRSCCPHLGLATERTVMLVEPTPVHRCYAQKQLGAPGLTHQTEFCLHTNHLNCPFYMSTSTESSVDEFIAMPSMAETAKVNQDATTAQVSWGRYLRLLTLATVLLAGCVLYFSLSRNNWALQISPTQLPTQAKIVAFNPSVSETATDLPATTVTLVAATATPTQLATALPTPTEQTTATPALEANGQLVRLKPGGRNAGWWKNEDVQRGHLGDSYLYAGAYGGENFIAAIRFDLSDIPRGAPIRQAQFSLMGLRGDQIQPNASGTWLIQLVPESSLKDLTSADFLTMLSAPASFTLFPTLTSADLAVKQINQWELDETIKLWLEKQLLDGATSLIVRMQASTENDDALFAWDSGAGSESGGNAPTLLLNLGPPPPTPPPLPTKQVFVATLTSVPKDVLTVVAIAKTATAMALTTGTYTPVPYEIVTPTPFPANLETVQAVAIAQELPPVVLHTPTPASFLEATRQADYATAVALTTGTFTPVPTDFVTPALIAPSPPAENVATEAARVVAATAAANRGGPTPTSLPYNAVIAEYVYTTPLPENAATAAANAVVATAFAKVNGTPTPLPWNVLVITPIPPTLPAPPATPTPTKPIESVTEFTPTPILTPTIVPSILPDYVHNKILFKTIREGRDEIYAMDPMTGELYRINEPWVYPLAETQLKLSPDGKQVAIVKADSNRILQIHIQSYEYNTIRQLSAFNANEQVLNYDPAWSPRNDLIAFVSTNNGNDEIYTITLDGTVAKQLTANKYEWDKHPTWSPDGSQIVFYSNRETGRRQLWIMNVDGSSQRNLSSNPYEDWDPVWVR